MKLNCVKFLEITEPFIDVNAFLFRCADVVATNEQYIRESAMYQNSSPYLCFNGQNITFQLRTEDEVAEMNMHCCSFFDLIKHKSQ